MPSKRTQELILEPLSIQTFFRAALPYALRVKWVRNKNKVLSDTELDMDTMETQEVPLLYTISSENRQKLFPATKKDAEYIAAAKKRRDELFSFGNRESWLVSTLTAISFIIFLICSSAYIGTCIYLGNYIHNNITQNDFVEIIYCFVCLILFVTLTVESSMNKLMDPAENTILFSEMSKVKVSVIVDNEYVLGAIGSNQYTQLSRKIADAIYDDDFSRCAHILNCEPNFNDVIDKFKDTTTDSRLPYIPFVSDKGISSQYCRNTIPKHVEDKVGWKIYETTIDMLQHLVRTSPTLLKDSYGRDKLSMLLTVTALKSFQTLLPIVKEEQAILNEEKERKNHERKAKKQQDHDEVDAVFQSFFDVL